MSQQTSNTPAEPLLCEMGCGFFGSAATGNCCSTCWRLAQKKKDGAAGTSAARSSSSASTTPMEVETPPSLGQPTHVQEARNPATTQSSSTTSVAAAPEEKVVKKKKTKKTSYKSMMANMTKRTKDENDIRKEKEDLRKVTGGGVFAKIDKI